MKNLLEFYKDKETSENVYNYLIDFLEKETIRRVFNKEDVSAISDAKDIIDEAWDNMDVMFESKGKKKDIINHSR